MTWQEQILVHNEKLPYMLKIKNKRTSKIEFFLDIDKINEDTKTKSIKFDRIWSNFLDKKKALIECFKNKKKDVKMCYFDVILMVKWDRISLVIKTNTVSRWLFQ